MAVLCSKCKQPNDRDPHRYCRRCHNAYVQAHRPKHSELTDEERLKANCRAYTNILIKRGVIVRGLCRDCGSPKVEAHHTDYTQPRLIVWLCRGCHRREHS